jgi:hypothetical protein
MKVDCREFSEGGHALKRRGPRKSLVLSSGAILQRSGSFENDQETRADAAVLLLSLAGDGTGWR